MTLTPTPDDVARRSQTLQALRLQAGPRDDVLDGLCRLAVSAGLGQGAWVVLADDTAQWIKGAHLRDDDGHLVEPDAAPLPLAGTPAAAALDGEARLAALVHPPVPTWSTRPAWHMPLRLDGLVIGGLIVLPATPGSAASAPAPAALADLTAAVEAHLGARLSLQRARLREARMRTASQAASDWLWETDADGRLTWVSENTWLHTGLPRGEAWQAAAFEELEPPEDAESRAAWQRYLQARQRREPFSNAVGERDMPGGRMVMQISGIPVFDSAGRFRGYRGATRDITREQQIRGEALRAQRLLQQALESVNASMMISDADGRIVLSNAAWRAQHGTADGDTFIWDEVVRAEVAAGCYPDAVGREESFVSWLLGLAAPEPQRHEVRWNNRWLLISDRLLADGSRVHLSIDITERKQAELAHAEQEARLRLSEARLDAVLRAIPDLWFVLDQDDCWRECGQPQHPLLSRPFETLVGRRFDADCPAELAERTRQALVAAHATGQVQRIEYEMPTQDGELRSIEARLSPMPDGQTLYLTRDLTELRTLRRDVALMEQVLEAEVSLAMLVLDGGEPGLPIVYANPAFERLSGRSRGELWGQPWRVALAGARQEQAATSTLEDAVLRQQPATAVVEHDGDDGVRVHEWHISPVRESAERVTHFIAVVRDVTEQVRSQEKLRVSEELYRSVAAAISDGLVVVSLDGRTAAVNPAGCRMLGVAADALIGRGPPFPFTLLGTDLQPLPAGELPVRQVLLGGPAIVERTLALRRGDGTVRWLSVSVQPLRLRPEQSVYAAVATFRDITETLQAQQELAISEERWKFALEGADAGVWDWDLETNRLFLSPRWKEVMGYGEHAIADTAAEWLAQIHPDDRTHVLQTFEGYLRGELPQFSTVGRMRHRDGNWRWVLNRGRIVARTTDGQPRRLVGTLTDITQQLQAEEALRHRQAAELASRAKSEFLSRMSHEIRTPLNAVLGFAQLLRMAHAGPPQDAYVEHILRAGQHLLALVNDVLDLQRVEEGRLALTLGPVALDRAGREAIELLTPQARAQDVDLVDRLAMPAPVQVQADEQRLRQVLLNIGSNGIKYNRRGGQVRWSLEGAGPDRIALVIEDDGPGLTAEQLAKLFQPFERLGKETSGIEGTGLGLIIARKLTEEMGGSLAVSSEPGAGTRVRIEMPTLAQTATDGGESAVDSPDSMTLSSAQTGRADDRMRVLYVEDNRINALLFEQAFGVLPGIELRIAEDGQQALDLAGQWTPDVLVLDAHLPGMSGFEALVALRAVPGLQQTPAYMCSADAMPEDVARAKAAGFAGYWTKPIDIQQVLGELGALRDTLHQRRSSPTA
ncbi:MAG: PAS domain S-box protein [Pseudomonadota bacterium]